MRDKIIGVDIAKAWLDVACEGALERVPNTPAAATALLERIGPERIAQLAFEPTGGYERALVAAATLARVPLRPVHPNALVAFRALHRTRAKTDTLDARLIAAYAALIPARPEPEAPRDPALKAQVARRSQLRDLLHAERCRRDLAPAETRDSHERLIRTLTDEMAVIEARIKARLAESPAHQRLAPVLQAVKGVGPVTVATLLADLPELGRRGPKAIAALVGLAPCTRHSGTAPPRARLGHGRTSVRQVLFNAARAAIRANPALKAFFQRLRDRGKPGKLALAATMRKLLVILNAKARDVLAQPT